MHTPQLFTDLLIILLASVPVAVLCVRLKLPLIAGFMIAGMAIGPYGLGLIKDTGEIEVLAEIGVMLLLFTIGLEFSPTRLREMRRNVLVGGGLQVTLTVAAVTAIATFLGRSWNQSLFFGFLIALSSTAIVLKSYIDRNEVDSPHGRISIGILIFQDLSILVMLLLIPLIGNVGEMTMMEASRQLAVSVAAMAAIVTLSWFIIPPLLAKIVGLRSPELFLLSVVSLFLAFSWVTSHLGMSLALGAFIAGVVIANSDYSHQSETEVLPFRDVFNGIFFVSIGLLLSLATLFENLGYVIVLVVSMILLKSVIVWMVVRILGGAQRVAVVTALGLSQIGEFSFVLAKAGQGAGLLPAEDYQSFLAASVISMLATPFLIAWAPSVGFALQNLLSDGGVEGVENCEDEIHLTSSGGLNEHVIIVGYGLNGRNLARVLRTVGVPYTVLDLHADVVKKAKANGEKINFGDATRRDVLIHAGIENAWVLVLALSDPPAARRAVRQARQCNPNVHIIVRTRYTSEINELMELGANEVIPEEFETSIEIFARVLHKYGLPRQTIEEQIARVRRQRYEMLRSPSIPSPESPKLKNVMQQLVTDTVRIEKNSPVIGKSLEELDLRGTTGATVLAAVHGDKTVVSPGGDLVLREGDILLLTGSATKIEKAIELISPSEDIGGFNP